MSVNEWVMKSASQDDDEGEVPNDEEEDEHLCNCQFSLAYGDKILLNGASSQAWSSLRSLW